MAGDREPERRHDADQLASVEECVRHHRVGEHREDGASGEREHEGEGARRSIAEKAVTRERRER